jgi:hypothetical protein
MEAEMHIHGNQTILNAGNPYSAAAEKAAATQRAAHLRRMRRKIALEAEGAAGTKVGARAGFEAGSWMHSAQAAGLDVVEYHPSASTRDSDFA